MKHADLSLKTAKKSLYIASRPDNRIFYDAFTRFFFLKVKSVTSISLAPPNKIAKIKTPPFSANDWLNQKAQPQTHAIG